MVVVEVIIDANSKRYFVMQNVGIHKENLYFGRSGMFPDNTFKLHGIYARLRNAISFYTRLLPIPEFNVYRLTLLLLALLVLLTSIS